MPAPDQIRNRGDWRSREPVVNVPFAPINGMTGSPHPRLMGLAKNATVDGLAAMAANSRQGAKFLLLYGLPDPGRAG